MTFAGARTNIKQAFDYRKPMANTTHFSTKDRILGAAEELFAQHGFAGTSLRQVTSRADVNIAAVNYHFGSKENLVNEVFRRRMDDMTDLRLSQLKTALEDHPGELQPVLAAFVEPALAMSQDRHGGGAFVRVVARAYAEKNDGLRKFLSDHYGHVLREFGKAIATCVPGLSKEELYWRLDFLAGALTYAMADFGLIKRPADVTEVAHRERAARELIRFAEAGIRAGH
jgi:AcrR family transcriptional regulator